MPFAHKASGLAAGDGLTLGDATGDGDGDGDAAGAAGALTDGLAGAADTAGDDVDPHPAKAVIATPLSAT
jgi:hypothetical protein